MAPKKKIAQTVITEGKFYTISAANGKVVEVADYNIDNGAKMTWTWAASATAPASTSGRAHRLPASCGSLSRPMMAA